LPVQTYQRFVLDISGYDVKRVHLEPGGTELAMAKVPGGVSVTVPRLDVHAVVVAELQ